MLGTIWHEVRTRVAFQPIDIKYDSIIAIKLLAIEKSVEDLQRVIQDLQLLFELIPLELNIRLILRILRTIFQTRLAN